MGRRLGGQRGELAPAEAVRLLGGRGRGACPHPAPQPEEAPVPLSGPKIPKVSVKLIPLRRAENIPSFLGEKGPRLLKIPIPVGLFLIFKKNNGPRLRAEHGGRAGPARAR